MTDISPVVSATTLRMADVSEWQHTIDWAAYGSQNPAVIVRALYGDSHVDTQWAQNQSGARAHCRVRGWYHYLSASVDAVAAARKFVQVVGSLQPGEFVVLDLEEGSGDQRGRRQQWIDTVHAGLGVATANEWTYSGLYFSRAHLSGVKVEWLAAYGQGEPTDAHVLWQNTDKGSFAGIAAPCDGSIFHGDINTLVALLGAPAPTPTPAPYHPAPAPTPAPVNHNTGLNTEKPWGNFPLAAADWYGVDDRSTPYNAQHSHSGLQTRDQRAVRQIQREVGVGADGGFGKITLAAVIRWQAGHGLAADGRVGPITWHRMTQV